MGTWLRRLAYLLRQTRHDAELREEIEAHRSLRAAHLERDGLTSQEAADASRRAIGNVLLAREDAREVWLGSWDTWWQDVRYGVRTFRRNPAFTAVAVVTLALGIGVNAGIFTVVNAVLFRDLRRPDAHELVSISQTVQGVPDLSRDRRRSPRPSTSPIATARRRSPGVAAYGNARGKTTLGGDAPQQDPRRARQLQLLRRAAAAARRSVARWRRTTASRARTSSSCSVTTLWRTAFAADPGIVGRTIELNRQRVTVAGVAAEGTHGGLVPPRRLLRADQRGPAAGVGRLPLRRRQGAVAESLLGRRQRGRQAWRRCAPSSTSSPRRSTGSSPADRRG